MSGIDNYIAWKTASEKPAGYVITGTDRHGKRFAPIHTNTPTCYNIWRGTIWKKLENGKRRKLYEVIN